MSRRARWPIVIAGALVVPALLFVSANVLKYGLGIDVVSDALGPLAEPTKGVADAAITMLILLGPVIALAIVLLPIVRLRFGHPQDMVEATVSLRLQWGRLAVAAVAMLVLAILGGHIVAENIACWFGNATAC